MKLIVDNYSFNKDSKTVTFSDYASINLAHVLIVVNVTTNQIIYNFANPALGGSVVGNVLTLDFDTTAMANSDVLMIQYDDAAVAPASEQLLEAVFDTIEQLSFLNGLKESNNTLRTSLPAGTAITSGTLTTLTTLTTLANMAAIGGFSSNQIVPAETNMAAIQSNINNVVVS